MPENQNTQNAITSLSDLRLSRKSPQFRYRSSSLPEFWSELPGSLDSNRAEEQKPQDPGPQQPHVVEVPTSPPSSAAWKFDPADSAATRCATTVIQLLVARASEPLNQFCDSPAGREEKRVRGREREGAGGRRGWPGMGWGPAGGVVTIIGGGRRWWKGCR
ncbi:hypothetical protein TIFTF001_030938 [Ficus carica]|uniref:Uncharacterized protein n=1 Tax=Ficus carica TaxID=3494 RepID=A0AA88J4U0_FICCA|nr:hypothetical protein TIFTF001_030938 [Ficus carica]